MCPAGSGRRRISWGTGEWRIEGRERLGGLDFITRLIHRWTYLFVRNQYIRVPWLGKVWGYVRVAWASFSAAGIGGPGYWRGMRRALRREGWDGGRNRSGFSRTMGLLELEAEEEEECLTRGEQSFVRNTDDRCRGSSWKSLRGKMERLGGLRGWRIDITTRRDIV